jgi:hypothetical protein
MRRDIDNALFEQPGFTVLFDAWSEVFMGQDGEHKLNPAQALARVMDARRRVKVEEAGLTSEAVSALERMDCSSARNISARIDEVTHEW